MYCIRWWNNKTTPQTMRHPWFRCSTLGNERNLDYEGICKMFKGWQQLFSNIFCQYRTTGYLVDCTLNDSKSTAEQVNIFQWHKGFIIYFIWLNWGMWTNYTLSIRSVKTPIILLHKPGYVMREIFIWFLWRTYDYWLVY